MPNNNLDYMFAGMFSKVMDNIVSAFGQNPELEMFKDTLLKHWGMCTVDNSARLFVPFLEEFLDYHLPPLEEFKDVSGHTSIQECDGYGWYCNASHDVADEIEVPRQTGARLYLFTPCLKFKYRFEREDGRESLNVKIIGISPQGDLGKKRKLLLTNETWLDMTMHCTQGKFSCTPHAVMGHVCSDGLSSETLSTLVTKLHNTILDFHISNNRKNNFPMAHNSNPVSIFAYRPL